MVDLLCKKCNDWLGHRLDDSIRQDTCVRTAVARIGEVAPEVANQVLSGQRFRGATDIGEVDITVKRGRFRVTPSRRSDGSLVLPSDETPRALRSMLRKSGLEEKEIEVALRLLERAPDNVRVDLSDAVAVVKRPVHRVIPIWDGENAADLALLKIAYEWLAVNLGAAVYHSRLNAFRRALLGEDIPETLFRVERLDSSVQDKIHGIVVEENDPHVIVQIRLFGLRAFRVHFHGIAINRPRYAYTLNLEDGSEAVGEAEI